MWDGAFEGVEDAGDGVRETFPLRLCNAWTLGVVCSSHPGRSAFPSVELYSLFGVVCLSRLFTFCFLLLAVLSPFLMHSRCSVFLFRDAACIFIPFFHYFTRIIMA